jgi:predicted O-methyltransferase YrrM
MSIATGRMPSVRKADPFASAWSKMYHIFGWLTEGEARCLFNAATSISEDGLIIEVGAFRGRSTALLGETRRRVITVDPLDESMVVAKLKIDSGVADALQSIVDQYPNVEWVRKFVDDVECPGSADMLYIDGLHRYPQPLDDFKHFRPALRQGSIVAFHDYGREFGVTRTIDELEAAGVLSRRELSETMYVGTVA